MKYRYRLLSRLAEVRYHPTYFEDDQSCHFVSPAKKLPPTIAVVHVESIGKVSVADSCKIKFDELS